MTSVSHAPPLTSPSLDDAPGFELWHDAHGILAVSFACWIRCQAAEYRRSGTPRGLWLAARLDRLARTAEFLHAESPAQFDDRAALFETEGE